MPIWTPWGEKNSAFGSKTAKTAFVPPFKEVMSAVSLADNPLENLYMTLN